LSSGFFLAGWAGGAGFPVSLDCAGLAGDVDVWVVCVAAGHATSPARSRAAARTGAL
jgi:hypothetical protein